MVNSRNKGAAFERHSCNFLNDLLEKRGHERSVKRNLDQYQTKGLADLYFKNFAIECKRYKARKDNWPITKWWEQAVSAAGDKYIPILIYKFDRKPIYVVVPAWLVSSTPKNNQITYMCPLEEVCQKITKVLGKSNVSR